MKKKIVVMIFLTLFFTFTVACMNEPTNKGQQYKKKLIYNLTRIKKINIENKLINPESLFLQINKIKKSSPSLYFKNKTIYTSIEKWLKNSNINEFYKFGINLFQMKGTDNYGNVKISGYYTPIIKARKTPQKNFIYPIYSMPYNFKKNNIYLKEKKYIMEF